jgi:hypothetical protein
MSRVNVKVGIAALLVLLIAATGLSSALTLFSVEVSDDNVTYGETITIDVIYSGNGALKIVNNATGSTEKVFVLPSDVAEKSFTVDTTGLLYPGEYYLTILDENGNPIYNSTDSGLPADLFSGTIVVTSTVTGGTEVDVDIDDYDVVTGDNFTASVTTYPSTPFAWAVAGPNVTVSGFASSGSASISTQLTATGTYALKIMVWDSVNTTLVYPFNVIDPEITVSAPSEIKPGSVVTISGSTNVAASSSAQDSGLTNVISVKIYEDGNESNVLKSQGGIQVSSTGTWKWYWDVGTANTDMDIVIEATVTVDTNITASADVKAKILKPEITIS